MDTLPAYAKDLKLNFSSVARQQTDLSAGRSWVAPEPALEAAKSAAAVMDMNNIFYRFAHLSSNEK